MSYLNTGNIFVDALGAYRWAGGKLSFTVYFDPAGAAGIWSTAEKTRFLNALKTWSDVAKVTFSETARRVTADLIERKEVNTTWPAPTPGSTYPNADHDYPTLGATGRFNTSAPQWNSSGLNKGGTAFSTVVHEIGHALGLNHPFHDEQQDLKDFPLGGTYNMDRRIYTVMSYNRDTDAQAHGFGHVATPMAFDIAAIQALYGANTTTNSGNDVYRLADSNVAGTFFSCIWDTGGYDKIIYEGTKAIVIDLRPATLLNEEGGGGFLSEVYRRWQPSILRSRWL